MDSFMRKIVLILVMLVGALLFFMGSLGVLNQGFREEIPGAPIFLIVGLVLMVVVTVADRRKKRSPKVEARERNRTAVKSVMVLIAVIAGAFGIEFLWERETIALVKGVLLLGLAGVCLLGAYWIHRKGRADRW